MNRKKWIKKEKSIDRYFIFHDAFLIVFFTVLCLLSVTVMVNAFHKVIPVGQTKTEATIVDKYAEREWLALQRYVDYKIDPFFQFELLFEDHDGNEMRVKKEVTHYTYYKYDKYDTIPISYRDSNPLDIFIRKTSVYDLFDLVSYVKLYLYLVGAVATVWIGVIVIRRLYKKISRITVR